MSDDHCREEIAATWRTVERTSQPGFERSWRAAERRYAASRRQYRGIAAAAAVVAAVFVGLSLQQPAGDGLVIEVAGIMDSTSWSAPSDVLLPEHPIDIYQELPVLIESTEPVGGTLL